MAAKKPGENPELLIFILWNFPFIILHLLDAFSGILGGTPIAPNAYSGLTKNWDSSPLRIVDIAISRPSMTLPENQNFKEIIRQTSTAVCGNNKACPRARNNCVSVLSQFHQKKGPDCSVESVLDPF